MKKILIGAALAFGLAAPALANHADACSRPAGSDASMRRSYAAPAWKGPNRRTDAVAPIRSEPPLTCSSNTRLLTDAM